LTRNGVDCRVFVGQMRFYGRHYLLIRTVGGVAPMPPRPFFVCPKKGRKERAPPVPWPSASRAGLHAPGAGRKLASLRHAPVLRASATNKHPILHLIFGPALTGPQSPNPQRSPATPAVWLNQPSQIRPKSERNLEHLFIAEALIPPRPAPLGTAQGEPTGTKSPQKQIYALRRFCSFPLTPLPE